MWLVVEVLFQEPSHSMSFPDLPDPYLLSPFLPLRLLMSYYHLLWFLEALPGSGSSCLVQFLESAGFESFLLAKWWFTWVLGGLQTYFVFGLFYRFRARSLLGWSFLFWTWPNPSKPWFSWSFVPPSFLFCRHSLNTCPCSCHHLHLNGICS